MDAGSAVDADLGTSDEDAFFAGQRVHNDYCPAGSAKALTQHCKVAAELEIARAATELFAQQCLESTTVEIISDRTGLSLRTSYRHAPIKEQSLSPLLQLRTNTWKQTLREESRGLLAERIDNALSTGLVASPHEVDDNGTAMYPLHRTHAANPGIEVV
ncbi:hypothetical protein AQ436_07485 [Arthrobacter sp. EpRS66]|nr:hypothetical protein AQ436_07485 [Arthrobacter sp. EpRS66]